MDCVPLHSQLQIRRLSYHCWSVVCMYMYIRLILFAYLIANVCICLVYKDLHCKSLFFHYRITVCPSSTPNYRRLSLCSLYVCPSIYLIIAYLLMYVCICLRLTLQEFIFKHSIYRWTTGLSTLWTLRLGAHSPPTISTCLHVHGGAFS